MCLYDLFIFTNISICFVSGSTSFVIRLKYYGRMPPSPVSGKVKVKPFPTVRRTTGSIRTDINRFKFSPTEKICTLTQSERIGFHICKANISPRSDFTRAEHEFHCRRRNITCRRHISLVRSTNITAKQYHSTVGRISLRSNITLAKREYH